MKTKLFSQVSFLLSLSLMTFHQWPEVRPPDVDVRSSNVARSEFIYFVSAELKIRIPDSRLSISALKIFLGGSWAVPVPTFLMSRFQHDPFILLFQTEHEYWWEKWILEPSYFVKQRSYESFQTLLGGLSDTVGDKTVLRHTCQVRPSDLTLVKWNYTVRSSDTTFWQ